VLAAQAAAILIAQLAARVVRLDLGAEVASLLASWLVMPRIAGGPSDLRQPGRLARQCHRCRRRVVRVATNKEPRIRRQIQGRPVSGLGHAHPRAGHSAALCFGRAREGTGRAQDLGQRSLGRPRHRPMAPSQSHARIRFLPGSAQARDRTGASAADATISTFLAIVATQEVSGSWDGSWPAGSSGRDGEVGAVRR
jgi:hypothetical protein